MKLLYLLGAVIAVPLAWLVTTIYTIPELADFHSSAYLKRGEKASFSPLGHGLYKMQIFWHMTPFHAEVGHTAGIFAYLIIFLICRTVSERTQLYYIAR